MVKAHNQNPQPLQLMSETPMVSSSHSLTPNFDQRAPK